MLATPHHGDGERREPEEFGVTDPSTKRAPHRRNDARSDERKSLGTLFGDLTTQMQTLVRLEIQLAKTEFTTEVAKAGKGIGMIAGAVALAYAGLLALVASLALLLGSVMPDWLGALIAGALVLLSAAVLLNVGRLALKNADFKLDRTSRTLEEDALWMKQEAEAVKRHPRDMDSTIRRP